MITTTFFQVSYRPVCWQRRSWMDQLVESTCNQTFNGRILEIYQIKRTENVYLNHGSNSNILKARFIQIRFLPDVDLEDADFTGSRFCMYDLTRLKLLYARHTIYSNFYMRGTQFAWTFPQCVHYYKVNTPIAIAERSL